MKIWEPKTCCFCFDAKNGSLIIGSLRLISALLYIFTCASGILKNAIYDVGMEQLPNCISNPTGILCQEQLKRTSFLVNMGVMSLYSMQAFVSIMMIHGIRKRKFLMIIPFMAFVSAGMFCFSTLLMVGLVYEVIQWSGACFYGSLLVLDVLFLLVVRSHYRELKSDVNGNYTKIQESHVEAQPIKA